MGSADAVEVPGARVLIPPRVQVQPEATALAAAVGCAGPSHCFRNCLDAAAFEVVRRVNLVPAPAAPQTRTQAAFLQPEHLAFPDRHPAAPAQTPPAAAIAQGSP